MYRDAPDAPAPRNKGGRSQGIKKHTDAQKEALEKRLAAGQGPLAPAKAHPNVGFARYGVNTAAKRY